MYITYNDKLKKGKINNSYLIVGIDICKKNNFAIITDLEGNELRDKVVFEKNILGLNELVIVINSLKVKYQKTNVLVAMKSTGTCWENVYNGLKELDDSIECILVDTKDVINVRKILFGTVESDTADSLAIAKTATLKCLKKRLEINGIIRNLKDLNEAREDLLNKSISVKPIITDIIDETFPEYQECFSDYFEESSMILLDTAFCPQDILEISLQDLYNQIKLKSKKVISMKKLQQLQNAAANSIGIEPSYGKRFMFTKNLEMLQRVYYGIERIDKEIDKEIYEIIKEYIIETKIMNPKDNDISIANLPSNIESFDKFDTYKQLILYCVFNLRADE